MEQENESEDSWRGGRLTMGVSTNIESSLP
jgi:hypothetical protein